MMIFGVCFVLYILLCRGVYSSIIPPPPQGGGGGKKSKSLRPWEENQKRGKGREENKFIYLF